jgi:hypothetical protein
VASDQATVFPQEEGQVQPKRQQECFSDSKQEAEEYEIQKVVERKSRFPFEIVATKDILRLPERTRHLLTLRDDEESRHNIPLTSL